RAIDIIVACAALIVLSPFMLIVALAIRMTSHGAAIFRQERCGLNGRRFTSIGRVLRKFSIDEWPQLWNVLKGDMSLVGPRPAVPQEVEHYQRWQRRRLRMRPGLTCLWAVNGRDAVDFETWMKLDMQYIDN